MRHVLKMLETSAKGAQPRGEEAQRVLSFFMASLKNPTLVGRADGRAGRVVDGWWTGARGRAGPACE